MKSVKVLGTGCPKCRKLEEHVREAASRLGTEMAIEKVTGVADIVRYGVMITPALVVDGKVVSVGKVPSVEELVELLS